MIVCTIVSYHVVIYIWCCSSYNKDRSSSFYCLSIQYWLWQYWTIPWFKGVNWQRTVQLIKSLNIIVVDIDDSCKGRSLVGIRHVERFIVYVVSTSMQLTIVNHCIRYCPLTSWNSYNGYLLFKSTQEYGVRFTSIIQRCIAY